MALTLRGYATCAPSFTTRTDVIFAYTSAGTPAFTWSTVPSVGDFVCFCVAFRAAGLTLSVASGQYDSFRSDSNSAGITTATVCRTYQAGDAAPDISCGSTAYQNAAFAYAWIPDAGQAIGMDVIAVNNTTAAGTSYTPPAASASHGAEVSVIINLAFETANGSNAITQTLPTTPASYTAFGGATSYAGATSHPSGFAGGGYLTGRGPGSIAPGSETVKAGTSANTWANVYQILVQEAVPAPAGLPYPDMSAPGPSVTATSPVPVPMLSGPSAAVLQAASW